MKVIYAQQPLDIEGPSIFLVGPSPRAGNVRSWRPDALAALENIGFAGTVLVPETPTWDATTYDAQIEWEKAGLKAATVLVFWVPRDLETLPGFTTNVEWGKFYDKGNVVLGYPVGAPKMTYLHADALVVGVPVVHDLTEALRLGVEMTEDIK